MENAILENKIRDSKIDPNEFVLRNKIGWYLEVKII